MKTVLALGVASLGLGGIAGTSAFAQPAEPGDIGIYFDPEATQTSVAIGPFVPFNFFIISTEPPGGQNYYEFLLKRDPRIVGTVETWFPRPGHCGGCHGWLRDGYYYRDYLVSTAGACFGNGTTEILVQWQAILLSEEVDLVLCLEGLSWGYFNPPVPGYRNCDAELVPYGRAYEGCAVVNPGEKEPPVTVRTVNWGTLKSEF